MRNKRSSCEIQILEDHHLQYVPHKPADDELKVTSAEILEARGLRKQNESMKRALVLAQERLEALKAENRRILSELQTNI